jgi:hypothetical protein
MIQRVHIQGGFLDGEAIKFSPNLTCIMAAAATVSR